MSAPRLEDLTVKPGQPVHPAWLRLKDWAKSFVLLKGDPRIRLNQMGGRGTFITAEFDGSTHTPHWSVAVSGLTATVGMGTVEARIPTMNGVPLDGLLNGKTKPVPPLKLTAPGESGVSWVALRVKVTADGVMDPEDAAAATIVHVTALESTDPLIGMQPLALLRWVGTTATPWQIAMHHLRHAYRPSNLTQGIVGRHFFWAV